MLLRAPASGRSTSRPLKIQILVPIKSLYATYPLVHHFRAIAAYWANCYFWHGVPLLSCLIRDEPPELWTGKSGLNKLETSLSCDAQVFRYSEPFRQDSPVWKRGQNYDSKSEHC